MTPEIGLNRPPTPPSPITKTTQNPLPETHSKSSIQSLSSENEKSYSLWDRICHFFTALLNFLCCRSKKEPPSPPHTPPLKPATQNRPASPSLAPKTAPLESPLIAQQRLQNEPPALTQPVSVFQCFFPSREEIYSTLQLTPETLFIIESIGSLFFQNLTRSIAHQLAHQTLDPYSLTRRIIEIFDELSLFSTNLSLLPTKDQDRVKTIIATKLATPLMTYSKWAPLKRAEQSPAFLPSFNFLPKEELLQNRKIARAWIQHRLINEEDYKEFFIKHSEAFNQLGVKERLWVLYELLSHIRLMTKLTVGEELEAARNWIQTRAQDKDFSLNYERYLDEFAKCSALEQVWILYALLASMQQGDLRAQSVIDAFSIKAIPV